jgi:hypothetical protein
LLEICEALQARDCAADRTDAWLFARGGARAVRDYRVAVMRALLLAIAAATLAMLARLYQVHFGL